MEEDHLKKTLETLLAHAENLLAQEISFEKKNSVFLAPRLTDLSALKTLKKGAKTESSKTTENMQLFKITDKKEVERVPEATPFKRKG